MKKFGLWQATSLVVGNMVGAGILLIPASIAVYGSIGLLGWGVTCCGALTLAFIFSKLSQTNQKVGGPYTYTQMVFGDFMGFQMAWSYWISTWASNGAIAIGCTSYLSTLYPSITTNPVFALSVSLTAIWSLTALNILGIQSVGRFQLLSTFMKILPLILFGLIGLKYMNLSNILPLTPSKGLFPLEAIGASSAIIFYAFIGLESATIPSDSIKNAKSTIPKATLIGTIIAAFIYMGVNVSVMGIIPVEALATSTAPFADVLSKIFGSEAKILMGITGAILCYSTLNGWILLQGQIPMAAAQDRLFPAIFAKTNQKNVPIFGLVFSSLLITSILVISFTGGVLQQFTFIIALTNFSMLLPYLFSALAYFVLVWRRVIPLNKSGFIKHMGITLIGISYVLWAIYSLDKIYILMGTGLLIIGIPFYLMIKRESKPAEVKP